MIFWGTFFPLISEAVTGTRASVGPPWFDRYTVPLAIVLVLLSGHRAAGRVAAGDARRRAAQPSSFPSLTAAAPPRRCSPCPASRRARPALALFALAAFVARGRRPGARPRRRARGGRCRASACPSRSSRSCAATAAATAATSSTSGMAVLFVGIAGSTAFQHMRDARLVPGQTAHSDGYDVRYVRATGEHLAPRRSRSGPCSTSAAAAGTSRRCARAGATTRHRIRGEGPIGRFFDGESTSEVGLRAGVRRDVWTAIQPDIAPLRELIDDANQRFATSSAEHAGARRRRARRPLRGRRRRPRRSASSSRRWSSGSGSAG